MSVRSVARLQPVRQGRCRLLYLLLLAGLLLPPFAAALNLAQAPIYQAPPRKPLVLLSMSKDHTLFYKAYDDYSDLDGDGVPDTTYKNTVTYYGYFDSLKCYTYDTTNSRYEPAAATTDHYCNGTTWSGNFLNWVSMARIDVVRKVLYGGRRGTDTVARLGGDEVQRSRVVAWREGLGLLGVVIASISPVALGLPATTAILFVALGLAWWAWCRTQPPLPAGHDAARDTTRSPNSAPPSAQITARPSMALPFTRPAFRALLAVFVVNGIASALPATLLLFFVQDRLQAPPAWESLFLGSYFICAALAIPLWLKLVARIGLARTWGVGMLLSIAVFVFALALGAGVALAVGAICLRTSGMAFIMITLAFVWNEFLFALFLTNAQWQTLPILVAGQNSQRGDEWWSISAAALVAIVPMMVMAALLSRLMRSGLLIGAIK